MNHGVVEMGLNPQYALRAYDAPNTRPVETKQASSPAMAQAHSFFESNLTF